MTKSELIRCIADRFPTLTASDADAAVNLILEQMTQALAVGDRIEIRGFGSFALNYRSPRQGRNPKTGQKVAIPAKHVPHFKAGKELRDRVDATVAPDTKQQRKYPLEELLAQCKWDAPSPRVSGWDDMAPLGKELL